MKKDPHDRLKEARIEAGYSSAAEAATALDVATSTYTSHENGTRGFGVDDAVKYGKKYKVNPVWLLFGDEGGNKQQAAVKGQVLKRPAEDRPKIRELDTRAGAGGGGVLDVIHVTQANGVTIAEEAVVGEWEMPDSFIRGALRMEPLQTTVIEVFGDSGYDPANPGAPGSLFPGDRVIVDLRDRRPSPAGPFLVFDGIGIVVKVVEPIHGSDPPRLRLMSRNPNFSPYEVTLEEAHIIGRVRGRISLM
jgi:phage repressor protein C with HTH and peptisase S24 domain